MSSSIQVPLFSLKHSLECGQVFGWKKIGDWYQGIYKNHIILVKQDKNNLIYDSEVAFRDFLIRTFRLDDDLEDIYSNISKDSFVRAAIEYGNGLRIMRQEPFKCLISYICSANSSILNIGRMLDNLSKELGLPLKFKNYKETTVNSPRCGRKDS
jgi:N-glycosylase/DNA lyase